MGVNAPSQSGRNGHSMSFRAPWRELKQTLRLHTVRRVHTAETQPPWTALPLQAPLKALPLGRCPLAAGEGKRGGWQGWCSCPSAAKEQLKREPKAFLHKPRLLVLFQCFKDCYPSKAALKLALHTEKEGIHPKTLNVRKLLWHRIKKHTLLLQFKMSLLGR